MQKGMERERCGGRERKKEKKERVRNRGYDKKEER